MLGLLLASNMLLAAAPNPDCGVELCWSVSPAFCVSAKPDQQCSAELQISWSSEKDQDLCLYLASTELQCWQQQRQGQWHQQMTWPGKTELSLQKAGRVLLKKELVVLSRQPERRRRLVAPWSVF